jgi:F0F1-type ATP synthase assembly protein I
LIHRYAQAGGIALIIGGVFGFIVGEHSILEPLDIYYVEDAVHLLLGAVLAYAGFTSHGQRYVGAAVGGSGVVAILIGLAGLTPISHWFVEHGLNPRPWGMAHTLLHFGLGVPSIAVWGLYRNAIDSTRSATRPSASRTDHTLPSGTHTTGPGAP